MFLSENYVQEEAQGSSLFFKAGDINKSVRVRLLKANAPANQPAVATGYRYWVEGPEGKNVPVRVIQKPESTPENAVADAFGNRKPTQVWIGALWNYETESLQIFEFTQRGIQEGYNSVFKTVSKMLGNAAGSPTEYDTTIYKDEKNKKVTYRVEAEAPTPLTAHQLEMISGYQINPAAGFVEGGLVLVDLNSDKAQSTQVGGTIAAAPAAPTVKTIDEILDEELQKDSSPARFAQLKEWATQNIDQFNELSSGGGAELIEVVMKPYEPAVVQATLPAVPTAAPVAVAVGANGKYSDIPF